MYLKRDENEDLLADSHGICERWKKYYSKILTIYTVDKPKELATRNAKPLVSEPSTDEAEADIGHLKDTNLQVKMCLTKHHAMKTYWGVHV
jgi:hypothetical protein